MVMARLAEPVFCWRFALIISSMSPFRALISRTRKL
jgi:hypothetical protein